MRTIAGRLLSAEDGHLWSRLNIPAQGDSDGNPPDHSPGDTSSPRVDGQHPNGKHFASAQAPHRGVPVPGRPAPADCPIFHRQWLRTYDTPHWSVADNGARRAVGMTQSRLVGQGVQRLGDVGLCGRAGVGAADAMVWTYSTRSTASSTENRRPSRTVGCALAASRDQPG